MPSIGPVTAAAFVATLDDAQRFRHAHQVEAYLGLVPREFSSGDSQRRGPITKAGPGRARWLLIQAAVSILRRRPPEAEALWTWALRRRQRVPATPRRRCPRGGGGGQDPPRRAGAMTRHPRRELWTHRSKDFNVDRFKIRESP